MSWKFHCVLTSLSRMNISLSCCVQENNLEEFLHLSLVSPPSIANRNEAHSESFTIHLSTHKLIMKWSGSESTWNKKAIKQRWSLRQWMINKVFDVLTDEKYKKWTCLRRVDKDVTQQSNKGKKVISEICQKLVTCHCLRNIKK